MLKRMLRAAARQRSRGFTAWSHTVEDYYPVNPRPRWNAEQAPHKQLVRFLDQNRSRYNEFLDILEANSGLIHEIRQEKDPANPVAPHWNNRWFTALDAAALVNMLAWKKPPNYIEIGSGHSTKVARFTVDRLKLGTRITSIDPMPRSEIDQICDRVVRDQLEACDLRIFDTLEADDILFFDGSHRIFTNSDVTVFFFEILPRLKPGVIVQIHDIYLPDDYPKEWNGRLYSEQYLLAAMMIFGKPSFEVVAPIQFMCLDQQLAARVKKIFAAPGGGAAIPIRYPTKENKPGASFWIRTRA